MAVKILDRNYSLGKNRRIYDLNQGFTEGYDNVTMPAFKNAVASPFGYTEFGHNIKIGDGRVAISAPGSTTVGGSDNSGWVYLYDYEGNYGMQVRPGDITTDDEFGKAMAIGYGRLAVSAHGDNGSYSLHEGTVRLFNSRSGNPIKTISNPNPPTAASTGNDPDAKLGGIGFGYGVAIAGARIYISVSDDGGPNNPAGQIPVYVYSLDGDYLTKFYTPGSNTLAYGINGAHRNIDGNDCLHSDGNRLLMYSVLEDGQYPSGEPGFNIIDLAGVTIKRVQWDDPNIPQSGDVDKDRKGFARMLSMGNGVIAVSSYEFPNPGFGDGGRVFLFDYDGNFTKEILPPINTTDGNFGKKLKIANGKIYIGEAPGDIAGADGLYIYDLEGNLLNNSASDAYLWHGEFTPVTGSDGNSYTSSSWFGGSGSAIASHDNILVIGDPVYTYKGPAVDGRSGQVFFYSVPKIKDGNDIENTYRKKPRAEFGNFIEIITLYSNSIFSGQIETSSGGWEFKSDGTIWGKDDLSVRQYDTWCSVNPPGGTYFIRFTSTGATAPSIGAALDTWHNLSSNQQVYWNNSSSSLSGSIKAEISDQSDGSNILATGTYSYRYSED
jgi:hypothetical protein